MKVCELVAPQGSQAQIAIDKILNWRGGFPVHVSIIRKVIRGRPKR